MLRSAQAPVELKPSGGIAGQTSGHASESPSAPSFDWPLAYEAEQLVRRHIGLFLERNSFASALARQMREESATDFFEWIDHLALPITEEHGLKQAGFALANEGESQDRAPVYEHPRATLPRIVLHKQKEEFVVALR